MNIQKDLMTVVEKTGLEHRMAAFLDNPSEENYGRLEDSMLSYQLVSQWPKSDAEFLNELFDYDGVGTWTAKIANHVRVNKL